KQNRCPISDLRGRGVAVSVGITPRLDAVVQKRGEHYLLGGGAVRNQPSYHIYERVAAAARGVRLELYGDAGGNGQGRPTSHLDLPAGIGGAPGRERVGHRARNGSLSERAVSARSGGRVADDDAETMCVRADG